MDCGVASLLTVDTKVVHIVVYSSRMSHTKILLVSIALLAYASICRNYNIGFKNNVFHGGHLHFSCVV